LLDSKPMDQFGYYSQKEILVGKVDGERNAVFIEIGQGAHSSTTDILIYKDSELKSVFGDDKFNYYELTFKPYSVMSRDIDNDGIYEISIPQEALGNNQAYAFSVWVDYWYKWNGKNDLEFVMKTHGDGNYDFIIPERWYDKVGIQKDENRKGLDTWKDISYLHPEHGERYLMYRIKKMTMEDYEAMEKTDKMAFVENKSYVYCLVQLYDPEMESMSDETKLEIEGLLLTNEELKSNFRLAIGDN